VSTLQLPAWDHCVPEFCPATAIADAVDGKHSIDTLACGLRTMPSGRRLQFDTAVVVWSAASHDDLLRDVADYKSPQVVFFSISNGFVYAPYDGGADIIAPSADDVPRLRAKWHGLGFFSTGWSLIRANTVRRRTNASRPRHLRRHCVVTLAGLCRSTRTIQNESL
jgi:hypothetical protein